MKKVLLFILFFFGGINFFHASTSTAHSYTLMDMDTGRVLESKNKDTPMLIASISKIMTCILAIENGNLDEIVKVDDSILKSYGSGIYISVGEEIKLIDLLYDTMENEGYSLMNNSRFDIMDVIYNISNSKEQILKFSEILLGFAEINIKKEGVKVYGKKN